MTFDSLPVEIILSIAGHLDADSLVGVSLSSRTCYSIIKDSKELWKRHFNRFLLPIPPDRSFQKSYVHFRREYKDYFKVYPLVVRWCSMLREIESFSHPKFRFNWSLMSIKAVDVLGLKLFKDKDSWNDDIRSYLLLHRFVNGQEDEALFNGFLGGMRCYDVAVNFMWMNADSGVLGKDVFRSKMEMICQMGDVILRDKISLEHCNLGSFSTYFDSYIVNVLNGNRKPRQFLSLDYHSMVFNVPLLFLYPIDGKCYNELISSTEFADIKTSVSSFPLFHGSVCDKICHSYFITITVLRLDRRIPSIQLSSRLWKIYYENGACDEVSGPGVIGEYPYFNGAGDSYSYSSLCNGPKSCQPSFMCGLYEFVVGSVESPIGEPFQVKVPEIHFMTVII